ncbi:MAG: tetratricopeptide repeat protein [Bacteroidales bacterium]|jgi:tetratricopeptide (TPR) repeat protein|nr:tetratricopeptide repeat protein [Bacteroidales bacterium]
MKKTLLIIGLIMLVITAFSQNERKFVRNGNKFFMEAVNDTTQTNIGKFISAEKEYRKALEKKPDDANWNFNLADALYKQMNFEEATEKFMELADKMETSEERARVLHNKGNSQLMQQKIDESIESYKEALRLNPNDMETKYNLAYAQNLKKQQQNQDQDQNQDSKNEENKDQQQNTDNQPQPQNNNQQTQQNKISRENAEQLLQALQNEERDIQDQMSKEKYSQAPRAVVEKEW